MKLFFTILLFSFSFLFAKEGIHYSCIEAPTASYLDYYLRNQLVHLIEIDPDLYEIKPVKAMDHGIGRESVLSIAKRKNAIAAINGGFFSIGGTFDGKACGILKINDWYALPSKPRGCIGWSSQNKSFSFDRLLASIECTYGLDTFLVDGLNRERNQGKAILFTPIFNQTTLTSPDGEEIIIENGIITNILKSQGSSSIPTDGAVLSLQKEHPLFDTFQIGEPLSFQLTIESQTGLTSSEDWIEFDYIVGGTPLLIYNCTKMSNFALERTIPTFITNRHSRTAIGILPNGHWLFVVVDKTGLFDGMTIQELTDLMSFLGCTYALNLDGGGSSTLVFEHEVKNTPHGDEDEDLGKKTIRRVSDAIIVTLK